MLRLTLLLFTGILCTCIRAQDDYMLFRPGVQYLYHNPHAFTNDYGTSETHYYGAKVKSDGYQDLYGSIRYIHPATVKAPSPFGYSIHQGADTTRMNFDSTDYLILLPKTVVGGEWMASENDTLTIVAAVTDVRWEEVFGLEDSVKTIAFRRTGGGSLGTARISKRYGLVQGRFFYNLLEPDILPLAGVSTPEVGVQLPPPEAFNSFSVGNITHIERYSTRSISPARNDTWQLIDRETIEVVSIDSTAKNRYGEPVIHYTARGDMFHHKKWLDDLSVTRDSTLILDTVRSMVRYLLPDSINMLQPGARYVDWIESFQRRDDTTWQKWEVYRILSLYDGPCGLMSKRPTVNYFLRRGRTRETELPCLDCYASGRSFTAYLPVHADSVHTANRRRLTPLYIDVDAVTCGTPLRLSDIIISIDNDFLSELDSQLEVFPNPTQRILNVTLSETADNYDLRLVNAQGASVRYRSGSLGQMDVGALPPGVYMLLVERRSRVVGKRKIIIK